MNAQPGSAVLPFPRSDVSPSDGTPSDDPLADAKARFRRDDLTGAAEACRQALREGRAVAGALNLLGSIAVLAGAPKDAIPLLRLAVGLAPNDLSSLNGLGTALRAARRYKEAIPYLHQALRLAPGRAEVLRNLAQSHAGLRDWAAAGDCYMALHRRGALATGDHYPWAKALYNLKRWDEVVQVLGALVRAEPRNANGWYALGLTLYEQKRVTESIAAYRKAIECDPKMEGAYLNLASTLQRHGNAQSAAGVCRKALESLGDSLPVRINLGISLGSFGKTAEALEQFDHVVRNAPGEYRSRSNALFFSNYLDDVDCDSLFDRHREWHFVHAKRFLPVPLLHANAADPDRPLRVGYVSPDFKAHSCMSFLGALFRRHDRSAFSVYAYSATERADRFTEMVREQTDHWRDIHGKKDEEVAALIRQDEIDVLVDLAGHTAQHSLLVFARKPAPVQVTWLGYPGTTGLDAMDYRLSDPWLTPVGTAERFSETVHRLDRVSHCFAPLTAPPPVGPLPALTNGYVTFGSFNNLSKVSDGTIRLWKAVLDRVPGARFVLKLRYLETPEARDHMHARFAEHGFDVSRLDVTYGTAAQSDHLERYNAIDIALDTYPYGGMTTSCEALMMGVPVVSRAGERTAARYGLSVLAAVGLEHLAPESDEGFATAAAGLAGDLDALVRLRAELRGRVLASPLCDEAGFARSVEAAYRSMWRRWCARRG